VTLGFFDPNLVIDRRAATVIRAAEHAEKMGVSVDHDALGAMSRDITERCER
jgi:hypothetical protein